MFFLIPLWTTHWQSFEEKALWSLFHSPSNLWTSGSIWYYPEGLGLCALLKSLNNKVVIYAMFLQQLIFMYSFAPLWKYFQKLPHHSQRTNYLIFIGNFLSHFSHFSYNWTESMIAAPCPPELADNSQQLTMKTWNVFIENCSKLLQNDWSTLE